MGHFFYDISPQNAVKSDNFCSNALVIVFTPIQVHRYEYVGLSGTPMSTYFPWNQTPPAPPRPWTYLLLRQCRLPLLKKIEFGKSLTPSECDNKEHYGNGARLTRTIDTIQTIRKEGQGGEPPANDARQ